jgi:hypothetical protein
MTSNLGFTTLKRRQRPVDPMRAYDALPQPLRQWLVGAVLPWSATSSVQPHRPRWLSAPAKVVVAEHKSLRNGQDLEDVISTLSRVEQKTLAQDKYNVSNSL